MLNNRSLRQPLLTTNSLLYDQTPNISTTLPAAYPFEATVTLPLQLSYRTIFLAGTVSSLQGHLAGFGVVHMFHEFLRTHAELVLSSTAQLTLAALLWHIVAPVGIIFTWAHVAVVTSDDEPQVLMRKSEYGVKDIEHQKEEDKYFGTAKLITARVEGKIDYVKVNKNGKNKVNRNVDRSFVFGATTGSIVSWLILQECTNMYPSKIPLLAIALVALVYDRCAH